MSDFQHDRVDLTNCDREPIHKLSRIQHFGALIAVTSDLNIAHLSANCTIMLDLARPISTGDRLADHFSEDSLGLLRRKLGEAADMGTVERVFGLDLTGRRRLFDCALHRSGRLLVIEVERHERDSLSHHGAALRPIVERLEHAEGVRDLRHQAARHLEGLLGFNREMVYRFHPDQSGEVIAEARESHLEAFLNLRYFRTDISEQARLL